MPRSRRNRQRDSKPLTPSAIGPDPCPEIVALARLMEVIKMAYDAKTRPPRPAPRIRDRKPKYTDRITDVSDVDSNVPYSSFSHPSTPGEVVVSPGSIYARPSSSEIMRYDSAKTLNQKMRVYPRMSSELRACIERYIGSLCDPMSVTDACCPGQVGVSTAFGSSIGTSTFSTSTTAETYSIFNPLWIFSTTVAAYSGAANTGTLGVLGVPNVVWQSNLGSQAFVSTGAIGANIVLALYGGNNSAQFAYSDMVNAVTPPNPYAGQLYTKSSTSTAKITSYRVVSATVRLTNLTPALNRSTQVAGYQTVDHEPVTNNLLTYGNVSTYPTALRCYDDKCTVSFNWIPRNMQEKQLNSFSDTPLTNVIVSDFVDDAVSPFIYFADQSNNVTNAGSQFVFAFPVSPVGYQQTFRLDWRINYEFVPTSNYTGVSVMPRPPGDAESSMVAYAASNAGVAQSAQSSDLFSKVVQFAGNVGTVAAAAAPAVKAILSMIA